MNPEVKHVRVHNPTGLMNINNPWHWQIGFKFSNGEIEFHPLPDARGIDDVKLAWIANSGGLSRTYPFWYWAANDIVFPLPETDVGIRTIE